MMPSSQALRGLPVVSVSLTDSTTLLSRSPPVTTSGGTEHIRTAAATLQAWSSLGIHAATDPSPTLGVYVGAGNTPVPSKLAERIRRWDYVDMAELLPEVRLSGGESEGKMLTKRPRYVTEIFSWIQCFGTYVSVLGPTYPSAIPELMAYMSLILHCSQDYDGLAWMCYDMAFCRQAASSGNRRWSEVNTTLYAICFTGKPREHKRCELCLASTHKTGDCLVQGGEIEANPVMNRQDQYKLPPARGAPVWRQLPPSGEICKLWNENKCRYSRCRHTHRCMRCGGDHPMVSCYARGM